MKTKIFAVAAVAALLAGAGHATTAQAALPNIAAPVTAAAPDDVVLAGLCFGLHCVIKDKVPPPCTHRRQENCTPKPCLKHVDHRKRPQHVDHRGEGKSVDDRRKWDPRNKRGRDGDRKPAQQADNRSGPTHVDHREPNKIKSVDHRAKGKTVDHRRCQ